ncbi:hypothetical protein NHQ30_003183 [Ciborinia camelliae]|nr:hypothetical protein NHQ30_003183 [Ciborinia camelliae]
MHLLRWHYYMCRTMGEFPPSERRTPLMISFSHTLNIPASQTESKISSPEASLPISMDISPATPPRPSPTTRSGSGSLSKRTCATTPEPGDEDFHAVYEGMNFGIEAFENLIPLEGSFSRIWPDPNITSENLEQFALIKAWEYHASCSCPIEADDDDEITVLDTNFKMRGVDEPRVVD